MKTVLDEVWDDFPRMQQYEVRGALGQFLFTGDEVLMRAALKSVVSEYRDPENVNAGADASKEMKMADENAAG